MYTLRMIKTFYLSKALGRAPKVANLERTIELPFPPMPGLIIKFNSEFHVRLDKLTYSPDSGIFFNESPMMETSSEMDFETEVHHYLANQWQYPQI